MDADLPIVHVRRPGLPWRPDQPKTECGLPTAGHPVISRAEFLVKIEREGERRARYSTCQTCLDTARRWPSWDEDPVRCLYREVEQRWRQPANVAFRNELLALAALAARHRDEFQELVEDHAVTVPITAAVKTRRH